MGNRHVPFPNHEVLPGMPVPVRRLDVARRRAFGSVPGLLDGSDLIAPSYEIERLVDVAYLKGVLYRQGPSDTSGYIVDGLALNCEEYTDIARNPEALRRAVGARTVASRILRGDTNVERINHREIESQMNMIISKGMNHVERITQYTLEIKNLQQLGKLAKSPGYALATEGELRTLAANVWTTSLENIITVVALRGGWNAATQKAAKDAMAYGLTRGAQRKRIGYWQDMIGLAEAYARSKKILFTQRSNVLRSQYMELNKQSRAQNGVLFEK